MATTFNPDKRIRKALFDMLNNIVVNTKTIKCYDMRVSQNENIDNYILLTSQSKERNKANKCEYRWDCSILIEIFCKTTSNGNNGSRVLLNDIEEKVNEFLDTNFTVSQFEVLTKNWNTEAQLETITEFEIITRSFVRLDLTLN